MKQSVLFTGHGKEWCMQPRCVEAARSVQALKQLVLQKKDETREAGELSSWMTLAAGSGNACISAGTGHAGRHGVRMYLKNLESRRDVSVAGIEAWELPMEILRPRPRLRRHTLAADTSQQHVL